MIASLLLISLYIGFRFEWKFAVPILIALAHDLLITGGVYALFGREVTTSTVAALLTIMGYSLYDTVIVFDRIRENVPRMPRATFSQIANRSMSEVFTRSLATSFVVLMPVGALLFFGGDTLKDFAFALLVGVASGAYSSIFIATPVLVEWKEREQVYMRRRRAGDGAARRAGARLRHRAPWRPSRPWPLPPPAAAPAHPPGRRASRARAGPGAGPVVAPGRPRRRLRLRPPRPRPRLPRLRPRLPRLRPSLRPRPRRGPPRRRRPRGPLPSRRARPRRPPSPPTRARPRPTRAPRRRRRRPRRRRPRPPADGDGDRAPSRTSSTAGARKSKRQRARKKHGRR